MTTTFQSTPVVASIELSDRNLARSLAGALQDLIEPPPDALTIFEVPAAVPGHAPTWRIDAYYDDAHATEGLAQTLGDIIGCAPPNVTVGEVPDENWVALSQKALPPVTSGGFTVHGSHDRIRVGFSPNAIEIDAGEAFGTAHHATTYGCLEAIGELTRKSSFANVLDLGCGSGVLAIAAKRRLPHARVMATDIDDQSCVVATSNMAVNRMLGRIEVFAADGLDHPRVRARKPFDLLIANILAAPLIALAKDIARAVAPGGTLVLSGLLVHQARQVIAAYRAAGFDLVAHRRFTEWSTLTLRRRTNKRATASKRSPARIR